MKRFKGEVVSTKMEKSAVVVVKSIYKHPRYKKYLKKKKRYLVDDRIGVKEGDKVVIEACRPLSKKKRFKIIKKI